MKRAPSFLYVLLRPVVEGVFRTLFRVTVAGREHVPVDGPVLLCCNHISGFDPPLVAAVCPRPVYSMGKEELFRHFGWFMVRFGVFPVRRGTPDRRSLRTAVDLLKRGEVVAIYPEGTRHHVEPIGAPKRGIVLVANLSGAPIVPVVVQGPYGLRRAIRVAFGPPRHLGKGSDPSAQILRFIEETMDPGWPH